MDFLDNILIHIISEIKLNRICVYMTNSKFHDEYNIVRWDLLPYNIQEGKKREISIGDLVVKTIKFNSIASAVSWFIIGNVKKNQTRFGCTCKHKIWGNMKGAIEYLETGVLI